MGSRSRCQSQINLEKTPTSPKSLVSPKAVACDTLTQRKMHILYSIAQTLEPVDYRKLLFTTNDYSKAKKKDNDRTNPFQFILICEICNTETYDITNDNVSFVSSNFSQIEKKSLKYRKITN